MGSRDIKLYYRKEWQAITDVDVWGYKYDNLIKDIMKQFLPRGAPVPTFRIECQLGDEYVPVCDNETLRRCLLLGDLELNMYVDIVQPKDQPEGQGVFNGQGGYFVEEVEDEVQVVVIDSDEEETMEATENVAVVEEIVVTIEDVAIVNEEEAEPVMEATTEDVAETIIEDMQADEASEVEEFSDEDTESSEEYGDSEEENRCVLSSDAERDESYDEEDDAHSENEEEAESVDEEDNRASENEDGMSNVGSDGEGMEHEIENIEDERAMQQINRGCAGVWFKKESDGSIKLRRGHLFNDVKHFREVLREYIIQEGFEVIRVKNEKARVTVVCKAEGCPWRAHASPTTDGAAYKIKTLTDEHNCLRQSKFRDATYSWIAKQLYDKFSAEPNKSRKGIEQDLKDMYGITGLSDMKLFRARQRAKILIHGDHKEQYGKVRLYGELLLAYNYGSTFHILPYERQSIEAPIIVKRCFMVFGPVKRAFLEGCRPYIGVDGCFLKGPYGGIFLSAVALDGNNGILPLAACVAEAENHESWMYFFEKLKEVIGTDFFGVPWTIMSDRQKGLVDAVQCSFPTAIQRFCLMHIEANFKLKFRGTDMVKKLWAAGRATNSRDFDAAMNIIKELNGEAYEWLQKIPSNLWSRHAFNPVSRVDHISNNVAESLNSWINQHRELSILTFLEEYRLKVMGRLNSRFVRASQWKGKLVPDVTKRINSDWAYARKIDVIAVGHGEFQCRMGAELRVINLNHWTCDCGKWGLTGIPCGHSIACIRMNNEEINSYCHVAYHMETYMKVYANIIHPQPGLVDLPKAQGEQILPPPLRRLPGRPRKARRLQPFEKTCTQRSSIIRCSICKRSGHNMRSCQKAPTSSTQNQNENNNTQSSSQQNCSSRPTSRAPTDADGAGPSSQGRKRARQSREKLGVRSKQKKCSN